MMRVPVSAPNLAPWLALFALFFLLAGCSDWNDVAGPQSSKSQGATEAFKPIIYDYPEVANHPPAGYQFVDFLDKATGRIDNDSWGDGDAGDSEEDYHVSWNWDESDGGKYKGVAKRIDFSNDGFIYWDESLLLFPSGALQEDLLWIWITRDDPPQPWLDFGPHGLIFEEPVTVRVSYDACELPDGVTPDNLMLLYWNEVTGEYEFIGDHNNTEEKYIEGQTDHFSRYIIAAPEE